MTDDRVTWLRAQLAAIESETRTLLYWAQQTILTLQDPKLLGKHIPGWHDWPKVEQMCMARLAEVDAKRRILDECEKYAEDGCTSGADLALTILPLLAPAHADRPGYRDEWRPA